MKYNHFEDYETMKFYWSHMRQVFEPQDTDDLFVLEEDIIEIWKDSKDIDEFKKKLNYLFDDLKEQLRKLKED